MLKVHDLSFRYEQNNILQQVNFSVELGKSLAVIGKSGSGKSTLIKLLYGLLDADEGTIYWKDKQILGPAYHLVPGMDFMKYVAQDFDLMPYTTLQENIGHFLSNFDLQRKKEKVNELLELVGLTDFSTRKVSTLSGGQMQRAALAKALASQPEILLLDEPFSHLDLPRKTALSRAIFKFAKRNQITVIFVSHIPEEALQFADDILILDEGKMIFNGTSTEAYQIKKDNRIAQLFGEINQLSSAITDRLKAMENLFRPHELIISKNHGIPAIVQDCYFMGDSYLIELSCENQTIYVKHSAEISPNKNVYFAIK